VVLLSDYHRRRTVNYANRNFEIDDEDLIEPNFSIDPKGRVICEEHTEINRIRSLGLISNQNRQFAREYEALLTCKKCSHFFEDNCFFPRSEINKIEADRRSNKIQCKLCGSRIDRPLTLMNKYYLESKSSNLEIPVICCSCYDSLEKKNFTQHSGKRILLYLITLPIYIIMIINILQIFLVIPLFFLFFLVSVFYWGYIAIRDIVSIYNLYKGRKYYNETFNQIDQEEPDN
jgi:hypothetical protein